ncbi:hypothetical protein SLEP1_g42350 [Rubroshorea leprosula]|uniref:Uncharacterized protein n=1 Tax=Rubroshorea leprosula TaxID=152421 RepID=A0AAV5L9I3_9ROSI|nr:hypothetical protein SLEP1_g42350 [Rubroshorea leprosula]
MIKNFTPTGSSVSSCFIGMGFRCQSWYIVSSNGGRVCAMIAGEGSRLWHKGLKLGWCTVQQSEHMPVKIYMQKQTDVSFDPLARCC